MYHDIADDLIHSIENKLFSQKLPTEHQLMERYNVSRNTIRKAIDIVAQKDWSAVFKAAAISLMISVRLNTLL